MESDFLSTVPANLSSQLESQVDGRPDLLADHFIHTALGANLARLDGREAEAHRLDTQLRQLADLVRRAEPSAYRRFACRAMRLAAAHAIAAEGTVDSPSLYRAFDAFDLVFGLDYHRDVGMKTDLACPERLYEGAGLGVQTSYATIALVLAELRLPVGALAVDLGSGYGRVGLVLGLLRDDTAFIGYEFVAHRVEVSNAAARALALAGRIGYQTKDLADPAFQIPEADAYYLYDPFCRETYQRVFARLIEIGRKRPIAVVMKGNGTPGFEFAIKDEAWLSPVRVDQGTAAIFRSAPSMRSSTVASS